MNVVVSALDADARTLASRQRSRSPELAAIEPDLARRTARNPTTPGLNRSTRTALAAIPGPIVSGVVVESVGTLQEPVQRGKIVFDVVRGAVIALRPTPSQSKAWLTRVARCHVARRATTAEGSDRDPFAVGRPEVSVDAVDGAFRITIRSSRGEEEAQEILRRSRARAEGTVFVSSAP